MSNASTEAVSFLELIVVGNYYQIAAAALLIYEQAIALGDEITYMWSFRKSNALFLLNRINILAMCVCLIFEACWRHDVLSCKFVENLENIVALASYLLWTVVSSLRVYAISDRNRLITFATFSLGIVPFVLNLYKVTRTSVLLFPVGQSKFCTVSVDIPTSIYDRLLIMARSCAIASEAIVVFVVWCFMPSGFKHFRVDSSKIPLSTYLWADGTS
ncbi:hypothetical protein DAEQUDRAFT_727723 [Daedalea quercina L-15889]|uniref:DUF6533 domain-containing protein n=1 Tax=Daedalea quercina L-15889 TaxID=1314783 RepID=A0A165PT99_9APHY|nr:hypothetical protein DAEQUDRAFT_727723 [Daedalea quercina L-15889]